MAYTRYYNEWFFHPVKEFLALLQDDDEEASMLLIFGIDHKCPTVHKVAPSPMTSIVIHIWIQFKNQFLKIPRNS